MRIRPMEIADLQQVCAIENDSFSEPWSRESFQNEIENERRIYLVAEEEGQILVCGRLLEKGRLQMWPLEDRAEVRGLPEVFLIHLFKVEWKKD